MLQRKFALCYGDCLEICESASVVTGRLATGRGALTVLPREEGSSGLGSKPLNGEYCTPAVPCQCWWLLFVQARPKENVHVWKKQGNPCPVPLSSAIATLFFWFQA